MGLSWAEGGRLYLDSNCFIYSIERIEPYAEVLRPLWQAAQAGEITLITSELSLLETLVKPLREGNELLQRLYKRLLTSNEVLLIPMNRRICEVAAQIRADSGLKSPDALHAATAMAVQADQVVTNDRSFNRLDLSIALLGD